MSNHEHYGYIIRSRGKAFSIHETYEDALSSLNLRRIAKDTTAEMWYFDAIREKYGVVHEAWPDKEAS